MIAKIFGFALAAACLVAHSQSAFAGSNFCHDYYVNTTSDSASVGCNPKGGGLCSLRGALTALYSCLDSNTYTIYLPAGRIVIDSSNILVNTGNNPLTARMRACRETLNLAAYRSGCSTSAGIRIIGAGSNSTIIDGGLTFAPLIAQSPLTLQNLRIANGLYRANSRNSAYTRNFPAFAPGQDGGAALNVVAGITVNLRNVVFENNKVVNFDPIVTDYGCGGAIASMGNIYGTGVAFVGNSAGWGGGAICNNGYVMLYQSSFSGNRTTLTNAGGGGAVYSAASKAVGFDNTVFAQNSSYQGGALFLDGAYDTAPALSNLWNARVSDNSALLTGGAIRSNYALFKAYTSEFSGNLAKGAGGAIYFGKLQAAATQHQGVVKSVFAYNRAGNGGAILNESALDVSRSLLRYNRAEYMGVPQFGGVGGAVQSWSPLLVEGSSIGENVANSHSGAISSQNALRMLNTTLFENQALQGMSAISAQGVTELKNNTFLNNRSSAGYDIAQMVVGTAGSLVMSYTIFQNNSTTTNAFRVFGSYLSRGYNRWTGMIGLDHAPLSGSLHATLDKGVSSLLLSSQLVGSESIGAPSLLKKLVIYRPTTYSPATSIGETYVNTTDSVWNAGCARVDGAGSARPLSGYCDAGAAEYVYVAPVVSSTYSPTAPITMSIGGLLGLTWGCPRFVVGDDLLKQKKPPDPEV
jgi:predicted outer membrane repeat protein